MYRIFIVEDDEVIARVRGEHLRHMGLYHTVRAGF